ncbi:MAG: hypothetical protein ACYDCP_03435 [Thermoplasmataceae archaeon]
MNASRKLVLILFIVLVIIIGGLSYYHSYVNSHSKPVVALDVLVSDNSSDGYRTLNINITAEFNSTNFLTNLSLMEDSYEEGLNLVYAGDNYSQAINLSISGLSNPSIPQLYGFNHFILNNNHPFARLNWNLTVYNFTSESYMKAPNGYYYLSASLTNSNGILTPVKLPDTMIYVENMTAKVVPNGR